MKLPTVIENKRVIKHNQLGAKSKMDVAVIVDNVFESTYFIYFNIKTLPDLTSTTLI
jgi:hypothetical protein